MKIIRLVSDELTKSIFQKSTSAPIMIKPNSSIALKSLSFELKHDLDFVIDSDDYVMSISTDNKTFVIIQIPRGKYNRTSFMNYLTYQFNYFMTTINQNEVGTEWVSTIANDDKVNICVSRSDLETVSNFSTLNITANENAYKKTTQSNVFDSYAQCKSFICRGGLYNLITVGGDYTNQFIYGLSNELFNTTQKTTLTTDDFVCCVFTDGISPNYRFKNESGEIINTNCPINIGDVISIKKNTVSDYIYIQFYIDNILIGQFQPSENFTISQLYTTFAFGTTSPTFNLNTPQQITSAFCQVSAEGTYSALETLPNVYSSDNLTAASIKSAIRFDSSTMQTFMGYDAQKITMSGVASNYAANNIFGLPLTFQAGDDLVVEIQNLNIDGYDFLENKKASIVAVIPIESLTKNAFGYSYIEPFPTFLSLNNDQLTNINSFYVSIKSGGQYLDLTDKIFMQLLING